MDLSNSPGSKEVIMDGPQGTSLNAGAPPPAPAATEAPAAPLYKGIAGEANSPEELVAITKKLEQKLVEKEISKPSAQTVESFQEKPVPRVDANAVKSVKEQYADMVYTDPEKAFDLVLNAAVQTIEDRSATREGEKKWWDEFYTENPDLKGAERVVRSVVGEKHGEIGKLSLTDAKKFLATESRKFIGAIKSQFGVTETELPSGQANAFGASNGPSGAPKVETAQQPLSFVDQVKAQREKRKRA